MEDREVFAREIVTNDEGKKSSRLYITEAAKKRWNPKNPRKFTPDIAIKIALLMRNGGFVESCAHVVGIHKDTLYDWLKTADKAQHFEGREPERDTEELRAFRREFWSAIGQAEADAAAGILRAGHSGTWQALAWYLERRHPDRWRQRNSVIPENADGTPYAPSSAAQTSEQMIREVAALQAALKSAETKPDGSSSS